MKERSPRKPVKWGLVVFGACLLLYGLLIAAKGSAVVDIAEVSGPNVRVAGIFLVIVGLGLIVIALRRK